jgi:hypothetical protein
MNRFQWADPLEEQDLGGPVDARPGVILSRRRFVSLALYTSAAVVLSGTLPMPVEAAPPIEPLASGPSACMPAVPAPDAPLEIIPYGALERQHILYRAGPSA